MESMLVDQHMRAPGLRPFDLEMASSTLTMEEKALLQARIQLLGLRTPFPTSGPVSPHGLSPHQFASMNHMGMHGGGGFPHFGPPAGSPPSNQAAAAAAAAANALNINGSLSQLYAMAAASQQHSPGASSPGGGRGGPGGMPGGGDPRSSGGGSTSPGGPSPQVPFPIQLWTQWASLHGLAPTLLAHHAQLAAAMAAVSTSSASSTSPNHLSSLHHHNGPGGGMPPGRPLSNGSSNAPPGSLGGPSNESTLSRLPRPGPMYPVNSSGGGPTPSSPISGMHRYSPYSIPINNSGNRSHHLSGGGGGSGSVGSLSNKSPSPIGSPDSLRDEVLS